MLKGNLIALQTNYIINKTHDKNDLQKKFRYGIVKKYKIAL